MYRTVYKHVIYLFLFNLSPTALEKLFWRNDC